MVRRRPDRGRRCRVHRQCCRPRVPCPIRSLTATRSPTALASVFVSSAAYVAERTCPSARSAGSGSSGAGRRVLRADVQRRPAASAGRDPTFVGRTLHSGRARSRLRTRPAVGEVEDGGGHFLLRCEAVERALGPAHVTPSACERISGHICIGDPRRDRRDGDPPRTCE
jgi:hypothetical protein